MAVLEFEADGRQFEVSYKMLRNLARNFPDDEKYSKLALNLVKLGIPSLSRIVLENARLSKEDADEIWANGDTRERRKLLEKGDFIARLSTAQAHEIMQLNDARMLAAIAANGERLFNGPNGEASRIDGETAAALMDFVRASSDWRVRRAVALNTYLPQAYMPNLAEQLEFGQDPFSLNFAGMTEADLPCLIDAPANVPFYLVQNLGKIKDVKVRRAAVEYLIHNPDPGLRLAFAEAAGCGARSAALMDGLRLLLDDSDKDIAAAAQKSLAGEVE